MTLLTLPLRRVCGHVLPASSCGCCLQVERTRARPCMWQRSDLEAWQTSEAPLPLSFLCLLALHFLSGACSCKEVSAVGHASCHTPRSEALQVGDTILSINGTATEHLVHSEVEALLQNSGDVVNLEILYEPPPGDEEEDGRSSHV